MTLILLTESQEHYFLISISTPSSTPLQFRNYFCQKGFGDILCSRFINVNDIIARMMWDASQVVCLERACLSSVPLFILLFNQKHDQSETPWIYEV